MAANSQSNQLRRELKLSFRVSVVGLVVVAVFMPWFLWGAPR